MSTDAATFYADTVTVVFGDHPIDYERIWNHSVPGESDWNVSADERLPPIVLADPDEGQINSSYVERHNLTMRQSLRRLMRRSNAHSKNLQNHRCAIATHMSSVQHCLRLQHPDESDERQTHDSRDYCWAGRAPVNLSPVGRTV